TRDGSDFNERRIGFQRETGRISTRDGADFNERRGGFQRETETLLSRKNMFGSHKLTIQSKGIHGSHHAINFHTRQTKNGMHVTLRNGHPIEE
ncbi:MAG: hypothetical protein ACRCSQ_00810, partial [Bacteroidales bacterium]